MRAGFAKVDITPRLGVEMAGFGPYLHRVAREVRDPLFARAMAVADDGERWVLVSCELLGVETPLVAQAREAIASATGLADRQIMIHATHTHSGPATSYLVGWGEPDAPYIERLPALVARAAVEALGRLAEASLACAAPPVEHIAYNREREGNPDAAEALREDWRPRFPGETDRRALVIRVESGGRLVGFLSSYSCHPVTCCEATHSLHGDFVGVATNLVEREHAGSVGIFLQGSHGDINPAFCHQPQEPSMRGLQVMAERYARSIRAGLASARPLAPSPVGSARECPTLRRADWSEEKLVAEIASLQQKVLGDPRGDDSEACRLAMVHLAGMRRVLADLRVRGTHAVPVELQALRAGDLFILGAPFELFRGIKERLVRESALEHLLVLSMTNGAMGYAVTRERFEHAPYATGRVPLILGICPFSPDLEDEIVDSGLRLTRRGGPLMPGWSARHG